MRAMDAHASTASKAERLSVRLTHDATIHERHDPVSDTTTPDGGSSHLRVFRAFPCPLSCLSSLANLLSPSLFLQQLLPTVRDSDNDQTRSTSTSGRTHTHRWVGALAAVGALTMAVASGSVGPGAAKLGQALRGGVSTYTAARDTAAANPVPMLPLSNQPHPAASLGESRLFRLGAETLTTESALGQEAEVNTEADAATPEEGMLEEGTLEEGTPEEVATESEEMVPEQDAETAEENPEEENPAEVSVSEEATDTQPEQPEQPSDEQSEQPSESDESNDVASEGDAQVESTEGIESPSDLPPVQIEQYKGTLGGLAENGQPTFDTRMPDEFEAFRTAGFGADAEAANAGDDAFEAASAYIFDENSSVGGKEAMGKQAGEDGKSSEESSEESLEESKDKSSTSPSFYPKDLLAVAMRDDPIANEYLPPTLNGFDMLATDWFHKPVEPRGGGENKFKVCIDQGAKSWDSAYAIGLDNLFRGGVCFDEVTEDNCQDADVVIFNEGVFLWGAGHRNAAGAIELPPKSNENQVYLYFAHEAAGTFGWELKDDNVMKQFDYLAYFDRSTSAVWWPFGPTLRSMLSDFKFYARPRKNRVPGVAWLAVDCLPLRTRILQEIAVHFPVFSIGTCQNNAQSPAGLPGRGSGESSFQDKMSDYMFYFAVENGGECPGYATEKVFLALARGSVPIYFGDEQVVSTMPSPESFVDLKKYDSPEKLAARLHAIATDDKVYDEVHAWRYQDPSQWSQGFRELIRVMSTDVKYSVCHVLHKGTNLYPEAKAQTECNYDFSVMGQRVDAWPDHGSIKNPLEHFDKTCEEAKEECWTFKNPEVYAGVDTSVEDDAGDKQSDESEDASTKDNSDEADPEAVVLAYRRAFLR